MRTRDFILIGAPMLLGVYYLITFILRSWKVDSIGRSLRRYGIAHERLTDWLIDKRIFRSPMVHLVSPLRQWAFAEFFALLVFLAIVSGNRSVAGLLEAVVMATLLGFALVSLLLRCAAQEALRSLQRDLPVACFLFSLLLESGMGASSALQETSVSIPEGALAKELGELVRSRTLGVSRGDSIARSQQRVPVEEYRLFLNHVVQGERLGIGLSRSLRELSGNILERQGHRAETIAQQAAVKMLFPLVVFIFPAVFLIILSPVFLGLWDRFAG